MKKTISLVAMSFSMLFVSVANAKTPPEVLKPYKAYNVAHKANNHVEARKLAYEAWQKAEELMGDSPTTAALARKTQRIMFLRKLLNMLKPMI